MRDILLGLVAVIAAVGIALAYIGMFVGVIALFTVIPAAILYFAWSLVLVPVFAAPPLSFLQAWALWLLIGLITGSFKVRTKTN